MVRFTQQLQARRQAGETDQAFARRLGISQSAWSRIQRGLRRVPQSLAARAIATWPELGPIYLDELTAKERGPDAA